MEKYESLGVVGEGSYGLVIKCRHRETGQLVAIKKFLETEDDLSVRKMALREIRMLKRLRHENLVNMLEVFRRKRRFYLVFDFMDHTILDELEATGGGLGEKKSREHIFQVARGIDFCHSNNIIHRDVKPENVLVSSSGVIKLCDFGFARLLSGNGDTYTDYVATRWYRAPELLVPDTHYGKAVDIWAIGCLFAEMMAGEPLFPGDSDIDQLFLIMKVMGKLSQKHQQLVVRNPMFKGLKRNDDGVKGLPVLFPLWSAAALDFLECCLKMDPLIRPSSSDLLQHGFFSKDNFTELFLPELRQRILQEFQGNPLFRKLQGSAPRRSREPIDVSDEKSRRCSFMEPPRWRAQGIQGDSRRPSIELNRSTCSSRGGPQAMDTTEETENRLEERSAREGPISLSPLQPLQSIIHPSISNLSFRNTGLKCSPVTQNSKPSHGSLLGRRTQLTKRLDRPFEATTLFAKHRDPITPSPPPWLASKRGPSRDGISRRNTKHHPRGGMEDDFSLPNLPGVTSSPKKGAKKKVVSLGVRDDDVVMASPRNQNSLTPSAGSRSRGHPSFPYM